ncbi:single-stranded-DNA-specific exonuclease RecJ [Paenibacillus piri]|uniref:Single-stranded-DNA-specific exonuclease RecJ n=1 Tax=Paenibacillus piri TaxID=2547395 RepID=A0A4R5KQR6_9BACL|nr:single-stranded-DNA-specific exonuclease RecJ [Paenibacillus piri]TDF97672.1 single-stranded-DNA-specific exonuclease RecJ [Paenibacillus piri]
MLHARARWNTNEADDEQVERLAKALEIEPLIARLLIVRGMADIEHASVFLHGGTDLTHDPFLLDGMDKAASRIRRALERGEKIRIYGDYDADGVSSTTLMVHLLRQLNAVFDYYIPHRVHEGYGLNKNAIMAAHEQEIGLIITVDTGISAVEEIAFAAELGMDVIVTDHHEPPEFLPEAAYVLINPKKPGCPYPFKQLAGVGVALKLAQALLGRWPEELLEFAAIGTIADLMPLQDENRIIVKQGVKRMQSTANRGIRALLQVAGIQPKDVNATHIGFALAPRINASGRLNNADDAVRLLIAEQEMEAEQLAFELDQLNKERQRLVDEMAKQAVAMMEQKSAAGLSNNVIVLAHEDWNVGVIGIVASKMVDKYYRPAIIFGIDKQSGMAKGSARSIAGFDVYRALTHCHDLMEHFGGHQAAAGMTLSSEHLPELERRLNGMAEEWLTPDDFMPLLHADIACSLDDIGIKTIQQLEQLGPFGMGNPVPKFVVSNVCCQELRTIGKEQQHIKLTLQQSRAESASALDAVGFNKSSVMPWISSTASLDIIGELSINEWNGIRKPQMMIQDLRVPHIQLFDWRGASRLEIRLRELSERLASDHAGADKKQAALITFQSANKELVLKWGDSFPVWGYDSNAGGRCLALNELARNQPLEASPDLVLYDLPANLSVLSDTVGRADCAQRFYAVFESGASAHGTLPTRDMFKTVYASVHQQNNRCLPDAAFIQVLSKRSGFSESLITFMLDVFMELGLIRHTEAGYMPAETTGKKELSLSIKYQQRQKWMEAEQTLLYSSALQLQEWFLEQRGLTKPLLEDII